MVKVSFKTAFTMIELIFAIVIIAIAVISLPTMIQVISKGMEKNLAQEAIFGASVELMQASSGYWDANSMKDINLSDYSRVVNIDGDCNATTKLRPGHINQPFHRRCIEDTTITIPNNTTGNADFNTLNDFVHTAQSLFIGDAMGTAGYKNMNYTSTLTITPLATDTNIKVLTATIKEGTNIITVLKTEAANVGEPQYYKRTF